MSCEGQGSGARSSQIFGRTVFHCYYKYPFIPSSLPLLRSISLSLSSLAEPHPAPLTRRRRTLPSPPHTRAAAALRQRRRRRRSPEVPRRVSSFPRFGFSYKPFRFFSSLPIRFLSDFPLNRSSVLDRFFVLISFPKTLDMFSFFFRTVHLNERDHRLF